MFNLHHITIFASFAIALICLPALSCSSQSKKIVSNNSSPLTLSLPRVTPTKNLKNNYDNDFDGFISSSDCDNSNKHIYPGTYSQCKAKCGSGLRKCEENGNFSDCSCELLCEATGNGKCYYLSPSEPLSDLRKISTKNEGRSILLPGDTVYLRSGKYTDTFSGNNELSGLFLKGLTGTRQNPIIIKSYPGEKVTISPSKLAFGINLMSSKWVIFDGIEILNAWEAGFISRNSENITLQNMWIHQTDGVDNNNTSGINFTETTNSKIQHSLIHDNYDRQAVDTGGIGTENNKNIVIFRGGNIKIERNVIYQTPQITAALTGGCITYKHASTLPNSIFEVSYNILWNCKFVSIGSGTSKSKIHHNLILNSDSIQFRDFGGITELSDIIVEYNTLVGARGIHIIPTEEWAPMGKIQIKNNIFHDHNIYNIDRGIYDIGTYQSDELFNALFNKKLLSSDYNCFYNKNTQLRWNFFAANGGTRGIKGDYYSFKTWQDLGFDINSLEINTNLDNHYKPTHSKCQNYGWLARLD